MKSLKKYLSGEPTSPILECGDAQLQAASTMEARSRTPLPPSPTIQSLQEAVISSMSAELDQKLKFKPVISEFFVASKNKVALDKPLPNPKPAKPPRKYTPLKITTDDPHYELVERSYDEIEYRSNAWQTMGIDSPNHTEQVNVFLFIFSNRIQNFFQFKLQVQQQSYYFNCY